MIGRRKALHDGAAKGAAWGAAIGIAFLLLGEMAFRYDVLWPDHASWVTYRLVCLTMIPILAYYCSALGFSSALSSIEWREGRRARAWAEIPE